MKQYLITVFHHTMALKYPSICGVCGGTYRAGKRPALQGISVLKTTTEVAPDFQLSPNSFPHTLLTVDLEPNSTQSVQFTLLD